MSRLAAVVGSLLLAATASAANVRRDNSPPTVQLANGSYYGLHSQTYKQDMFLGMPFAQPPVGDLRFRQAQSLNSTWQGSRNATEYGYECIGYGSDQWAQTGANYVSEDCLTLNVVRPDSVRPGDKLPVAVWIHGGAYYMGGGSDPRYNTSFMVQQSVAMGTPIVAVTINYRLSSWGFLYSSEMAAEGATNLGMRDQRLALRWTWAAAGVPVYSYNFDVLVQGVPSWQGASHFQEVVFVFNNVDGLGYGNVVPNPMAGGPPTFPRLADLMSRMWVSFVVSMDPNNAGIKLPAQWPPYSLDKPQNYVFDVNGTDIAHVENDLWRAEGIDYISKRLFSIYGQ
ncbi:lipase 2 [Magnaporthiopsis poae ATCC 64411]|uniref:Lipase 2 n=1 Tax=Magnaporthiopsis poae (strain ATCC 64411 / 73-15) TaxID=644358 RepID=A0A0C4DKD1_MAGP6|nr:lipase 2 [Magnaporthiopsis poae ATCC 64411]